MDNHFINRFILLLWWKQFKQRMLLKHKARIISSFFNFYILIYYTKKEPLIPSFFSKKISGENELASFWIYLAVNTFFKRIKFKFKYIRNIIEFRIESFDFFDFLLPKFQVHVEKLFFYFIRHIDSFTIDFIGD